MILLKMFITFLKIGAFTFGGGYAMIPLIQAEVVDVNKWLTYEEFIDTVVIAQSAPGAIAVNVSVFVGYRIKKTLGAIVCTLAVVIPSFVVILTIAVFFYKFKDNAIVEKIFLGIGPAVVALISTAVLRFSKGIELNKVTLMISIVTIVAVALLNVNPIFIIVLAGVCGAGLYRIKRATKNG
ncbi:chromate transporter [Sporosalibacterium faouarense]|uniref:chromate transporter n=1 Tax=Sporosalibacterium faouarense TaxID=516123 RepID=UPI00141C5E4F|nr:chromate transporter [Sporosalibacterium faouarense]MTI46883.1 chromate transporter [Bacillota bacterium]